MDPLEFYVDPAHPSIDDLIKGSPIINDVWDEKYRRNDINVLYTFNRVAAAVAKNADEEKSFEQAMQLGLWMPGGRILAGAGTGNLVTLMNCYVSPDIPDSMDGIADALKVAMLTQQQGGGIGMDYSTLRPSGALLRRTGSVASGPLPFMDMWNAMCTSIMSAGSRRGAMMGTINDTHPDLLEFIKAKHTQGRLTNFNVSVLISDAFMGAVEDDADWELYFDVPPLGRDVQSFVDDDGKTQYIYSSYKARYIWDLITASTYTYSEPGVIFIDRINDLNNLKYVEQIHCTNPCGEQPLPANGTCNLGAVNLARMVRKPFTEEAELDVPLLQRVVALGQRFLDNVIDITNYPTEAQENEEKQKRRTGLGVSGLADCLAQLQIRYGSGLAIQNTRKIMETIALSSYAASTTLSKERGPFPLFDPNSYLNGFAGTKLPPHLIQEIHTHGIRNGVLLTIAPTGTTSILYGNISSGIEPTFKHSMLRKVRQKNGNDVWKEYESTSYISQLWRRVHPSKAIPDYLVEHDQVTVEEQVRMQAACQEWIDASVSKTVNCPKEMSFEAFQEVYSLAYEKGCKGCTTYRPSEVRGSILSSKRGRPEVLTGATYQIKWPSWSSAIYVTVNSHQSKPYEIFIASKDARQQEWIIAISILLSRIVRKADNPMEIIGELKQIQSAHDSAFVGSKRYGSVLGRIAEVLEEHFQKIIEGAQPIEVSQGKDVCPQCLATMLKREGCSICPSCSYSTCG